MLIVPGLFAYFGFEALIKSVRDWHKTIILYERGLAFRSWRGLHEWRWEDIRSIRSRAVRHTLYSVIPVGTVRDYRLTAVTGEELALHQLIGGVQELMEYVEAFTTPLILARAIEEHNAGRPVNFGPIEVNVMGLVCRRKNFAWDEIDSVSVRDGRVAINRKNGGFFSGARVDAAKISNLAVLLRLLDRIKARIAPLISHPLLEFLAFASPRSVILC
jgi:hypothetical protein